MRHKTGEQTAPQPRRNRKSSARFPILLDLGDAENWMELKVVGRSIGLIMVFRIAVCNGALARVQTIDKQPRRLSQDDGRRLMTLFRAFDELLHPNSHEGKLDEEDFERKRDLD